MVLEVIGLKKVARKLDWLDEIIEGNCQESANQEVEPGWFGKFFFGVGMAFLMFGMGIFTHVNHILCSKE
jgi:hypothetical protein